MDNWENKSTNDLKKRLKAELVTESPDQQTVYGIVEELEKRNPVKEIPIEVVTAWDRLRVKKKRKSSRLKPLCKVAVIAVVATSLLGIVPHALGSESIFEVVSQWTKDIFRFGETKQSEVAYKTEHAGLQKLYDTMMKYGVTSNIVPTWLPEGFEMGGLEENSTPKGTTVIANFTNGDKEIQIFVIISSKKRDVEYQKDEKTVEIRESKGIKYYIMENEGKAYAVWAFKNIECSIYADAKEDLYKIIKSIY